MLKVCLGLLIVVVQLSACASHSARLSHNLYGFRSVRPALDFGDSAAFTFKFPMLTIDGQDQVLLGYEKYARANEKLGNFFKISRDGGRSFGAEREMPAHIKNVSYIKSVKGGLAAVYSTFSPDNIFYTRSDPGGQIWSEPVRINDELDSVRNGMLSFLQPSEDQIYCIWTDRRRGFNSLFFSASQGGGRTWSPNQAIEYDFREGEQSAPKLLMGANGRLIACWIDWRDQHTLADIRCSYSDDGGQHWSVSQKINDDQEPVWQVALNAVAADNRIYVVFSDFREPGEEGDNDWNVYFTSSEDNGETWSQNIRVNDIKAGTDGDPAIAIDAQGILYCCWIASRVGVFGQVAFTFSTDGGKHWARSIKVNEDEELLERKYTSLVMTAGGRLACQWVEYGYNVYDYRIAWMEPLSDPAAVAVHISQPAMEHPELSPPEAGAALFSDDFASEDQTRWQVAEGLWMNIDGAYMGVATDRGIPFLSFARLAEPESYLMQGRFKLEPIHHNFAYLFFRTDPASGRCYTIASQFRRGAWLSFNEHGPWINSNGYRHLVGRPLVERFFPFRSNRWYRFTLVVTLARVDYFVDGHLMLSYREPLQLPPARVGIGGMSNAPTYFDDIVISEIK